MRVDDPEHTMKRLGAALASFALAAMVAGPAIAQRGAKASAAAFPDGPGRDVLLAKCFQCHGPTMWMMQRQDRRAWESTLYRMVGRGALWTEDDIRAMADYLAANYGRKPS